MIQVLLTSGCSFSEATDPYFNEGKPFNNSAKYGKSWARFLKDFLNPSVFFDLAVGGQGNDLISKRIIFTLHQALQTYNSQNIFVGIMWSGIDRIFHYNLPPDERSTTSYLYSVATPSWYNSTHHPAVVNFYNDVAKYIMTLENILRTQWFLQQHKIKYVMTMFSDSVLPPKDLSLHPEIKYLLDMIDFSNWACTTGQVEWCRDYSGYPFPIRNDPHPGTDQHREFFNQKILPFLKEKSYIDCNANG